MSTSAAKAARLEGRGIIALGGEDAEGFLQGLLTNDVQGLARGEARFAGLLTPQGKILFDFFLVRREDDWLIDAPLELVPDLVKRLTFYRLRAKVEIADESTAFAVVGLWSGESGNGACDGVPEGAWAAAFRDPRAAGMGWRIIAPRAAWPDAFRDAGLSIAEARDWQAHRIALAVPEGGTDYAYGEAFPHEACFDQLHGVDFAKGCYVGQEVVSRMQHRGTARRRIVAVRALEGALPETGTDITADGQAIGRLGSVNGPIGIAMVRLDRLARALEAGEVPRAGKTPLLIRRPDWATFDVPAMEGAGETAAGQP